MRSADSLDDHLVYVQASNGPSDVWSIEDGLIVVLSKVSNDPPFFVSPLEDQNYTIESLN